MVTESDKLCMEWGGRDAGRGGSVLRMKRSGKQTREARPRGRVERMPGSVESSWRCDLVARPLLMTCLGLTLPVSSGFCFPL